MVAGRLEQRSWETQEGDKRSKVEVVADEIGPSLRWATAQITKNERRGPGDGGPRGGGAAPAAPHPHHNPSPRPMPAAATDSMRSPSDGTEQSTRRDAPRRAPKDLGRRVKKKPCALCRDKIEWVDYKDVPHAAQVHERPRQDPLAPGHGQLRPAPAGAGHGHQDGARARAAALHPAHRDRAPAAARRRPRRGASGRWATPWPPRPGVDRPAPAAPSCGDRRDRRRRDGQRCAEALAIVDDAVADAEAGAVVEVVVEPEAAGTDA